MRRRCVEAVEMLRCSSDLKSNPSDNCGRWTTSSIFAASLSPSFWKQCQPQAAGRGLEAVVVLMLGRGVGDFPLDARKRCGRMMLLSPCASCVDFQPKDIGVPGGRRGQWSRPHLRHWAFRCDYLWGWQTPEKPPLCPGRPHSGCGGGLGRRTWCRGCRRAPPRGAPLALRRRWKSSTAPKRRRAPLPYQILAAQAARIASDSCPRGSSDTDATCIQKGACKRIGSRQRLMTLSCVHGCSKASATCCRHHIRFCTNKQIGGPGRLPHSTICIRNTLYVWHGG